MILFKAVGAVLLVAGGIMIASYMNGRLEREAELIRGWLALLRYIKNRIECFSQPIGEILSGCDPHLLFACGYRVEPLPKDISELMGKAELPKGEAEKLIREFFSDFGRYYREEQIKECDRYISALSACLEEKKEQLPTKKKLILTLTLSACLALIILLL